MESFTNMGDKHGVIPQGEARKIMYHAYYTGEAQEEFFSSQEPDPEKVEKWAKRGSKDLDRRPEPKPKRKRAPRKPKEPDSDKVLKAAAKDLRDKGIH